MQIYLPLENLSSMYYLITLKFVENPLGSDDSLIFTLFISSHLHEEALSRIEVLDHGRASRANDDPVWSIDIIGKGASVTNSRRRK
jgi:hypothetical protein